MDFCLFEHHVLRIPCYVPVLRYSYTDAIRYVQNGQKIHSNTVLQANLVHGLVSRGQAAFSVSLCGGGKAKQKRRSDYERLSHSVFVTCKPSKAHGTLNFKFRSVLLFEKSGKYSITLLVDSQ